MKVSEKFKKRIDSLRKKDNKKKSDKTKKFDSFSSSPKTPTPVDAFAVSTIQSVTQGAYKLAKS